MLCTGWEFSRVYIKFFLRYIIYVKEITIEGARTHNLKNIDLKIPRDQFVVITGVSGSGKSSLAFDTLYAEGQRRYCESLSAYARQFLSIMAKPDCDQIQGLSPAVAIQQKATSHNPRSTVGTITEIYDYMRLLWARVGIARCPKHGIVLEAKSVSQIVEYLLEHYLEHKIMILSPVVQNKKGSYEQLFVDLRSKGFTYVKIDGKVHELEQLDIELDPKIKHKISVVVDRIKIKTDLRDRLAESLETSVSLSDNIIEFFDYSTDADFIFSTKQSCPKCDYSIDKLEPKNFSFNSPDGACKVCDGIGLKQILDHKRIINEKLSLKQGAIKFWDPHNLYYFKTLKSLAKHFDFSLEIPFEELEQRHQDIILYGSEENITFSFGRNRFKKKFDGVIEILQQRYLDSDSDYFRNEILKYFSTVPCPTCNGARLSEKSLNILVNEHNIDQVSKLPIDKCVKFFKKAKFSSWRKEIAAKILKEIIERLEFLENVGLDYLTLARSADTLSGGEAQRIRLAQQIGSGLMGVMYILDEPSIGLHQKDNEKLLGTLIALRDKGNSVIVVEHDLDTMHSSDWIIDIGPGSGKFGGLVTAQGTPKQLAKENKSITSKYLSGELDIQVPKKRRTFNPEKRLKIVKASGNNLKKVNLELPIGILTCITGVSGSGKSTLINHTLYPICAKLLNKAQTSAFPYQEVSGIEHLDKVINIDQSPIGRTPRSNPATYTNLFTDIRELFSKTKLAKERGYKSGRFSFNVAGGRCEHCKGEGLIKVEMHFLPDLYVECGECKGSRYNYETLEVQYKGKNIHDVLEMTCEEALGFFEAIPPIFKKLQTLIDVGLDYIQLGQSAITLSGGEAQRVKLAKELAKRDPGQTLYILDEPTTGLHIHDCSKLLEVLHRLTDQGNTVVIIEHNLDVIKTADWVIDLGPDGGINGGKIIATGSPEEVAKCSNSYTGQFLKKILYTK